MNDLVLNGSIPGLLRRGSPVFWRDETTPYVMVDALSQVGRFIAAPCVGICLGVCDDADNFTLNLDDPTGPFHAGLWLKKRGFVVPEEESLLLAWSVLSVSRGGKPIAGVVRQRCWGSAGCQAGYTRYYLEREGDRAQLFAAMVGKRKDERAAKIAEALAAHYALRNEDGSLTLPKFAEAA